MKKLIALLAAAGAVVFFWRKKQHDGDSMWDPDRESSGSWEDAAGEPSGETAGTTPDVTDATE